LNRTGTVLVVAPKEEFRRSVAFALEAEGFGVESHALLASALTSPLVETADCAVIDDHAINAMNGGWAALSRFKQPIVLLSNHAEPVTLLPHVTVLLKPLLGRLLTDTVIAVVAEKQAAEPELRTNT
jgi:FixJ family two-component response regulator